MSIFKTQFKMHCPSPRLVVEGTPFSIEENGVGGYCIRRADEADEDFSQSELTRFRDLGIGPDVFTIARALVEIQRERDNGSLR